MFVQVDLERRAHKNDFAFFQDIWRAEKTLENAETFVRNKQYSLDDCKTSKEMLIRILGSTELQEAAIDGHSKQMYYGTINNVLALTLLSHTEGGWVPAILVQNNQYWNVIPRHEMHFKNRMQDELSSENTQKWTRHQHWAFLPILLSERAPQNSIFTPFVSIRLHGACLR